MAKRMSKHLRPPRPLSTAGFAQLEAKRDGEWMVSAMPADHAKKTYLCPGCNQQIPPGTSHLVVWPRQPGIGSSTPIEDRRHWHGGCWQRRS